MVRVLDLRAKLCFGASALVLYLLAGCATSAPEYWYNRAIQNTDKSSWTEAEAG